MGEIICITTEGGGKSIIYDIQIQNQNVKLDTKSMVIYTKNEHCHSARTQMFMFYTANRR